MIPKVIILTHAKHLSHPVPGYFLIFIPFYVRLESVSDLGKNLARTDVIVPDSSDGTAPEDPYA